MYSLRLESAISDMSEQTTNDDGYACDKCGIVFPTPEELDHHTKADH